MNVTTTRPRIWLTPATLASLKAKVIPGNDRWSQLLAAANVAPADWNSGLRKIEGLKLIPGTEK